MHYMVDQLENLESNALVIDLSCDADILVTFIGE